MPETRSSSTSTGWTSKSFKSGAIFSWPGSWLGTAAKGGKFHYYSCGSYLKGGKETCAARLINKNKLERAVLAKIQEQILTPTNIRSYIQRVMESALKSQVNPSPEQEAVRLALNDVQTRLQRWENALESYKLPLGRSEVRFFTPLRLVGPPGLEPGTNRL